MQFCPSYQIVQHIRRGDSPQVACESVVTDMLSQTNKWFEVGLIALDNKVQIVTLIYSGTSNNGQVSARGFVRYSEVSFIGG